MYHSGTEVDAVEGDTVRLNVSNDLLLPKRPRGVVTAVARTGFTFGGEGA